MGAPPNPVTRAPRPAGGASSDRPLSRVCARIGDYRLGGNGFVVEARALLEALP
jgi:hypothetical protein